MAINLSFLPVLFFLCLIMKPAYASGFQIYEYGNPSIGTAGVGQTVVKDASISYLNPAGMVQLAGSEIQLGSQLLITKIQFDPDNNNTFSGNNGGNAGALLPGMGIFGVYSASNDLKFGLSLTSPFGGAVNYNDGWMGRYAVQNAFLLTLDVNPTVAYRVNDWVSLGIGVLIEHMRLQQTIGIPLAIAGIGDGQADLRLHDVKLGFNAGIFLTPTCTSKIGLIYRSQIKHKLKGSVTFLRFLNAPAVTSEIKTPQSVLMSLHQAITPQVNALLEVGWANWRVFKDTIINIQGVTLAVPRNWRNTYRIGIGGEFLATKQLCLKAGGSYDSSAAKMTSRLPDLPIDRQIRIGTGIDYHLHSQVCLSANYEYINFGKARINQSTTIGVLSGSYSRNFANVIALNLNVSF